LYITVIKYLAPVVLVVGYTWFIDDRATTQERSRWEMKIAGAELLHKNQIIETERKWAVNLSEVDNRGISQINQLENDVAIVASERDRLQQLYANTAKRCAKNPATSSGSQAAAEKPDLHSELYAESLKRNEELAEEAEGYRIAGEACESYVNAILK